MWFNKKDKNKTENTETQRHPVDFDSLVKGSRITTEELEEILQVKAGSADFNLKGLSFAEKVKRELFRRGKDYIVVFRQESIWVLTDAESLEYIDRTNRTGVNKIVRAYYGLGTVDHSKLDADERKRFDRSCVVVSTIYQGVTQAVKRVPVEQNRTRLDKPFVPVATKKISY